jgi:AcrR family transcriptional regulator
VDGSVAGPPDRGPDDHAAVPSPKPPKLDGRTARAVRTREAIIDAMLAFNQEGELTASAERIVERAGVSLRTLWTNFKDLDGLYAAVDNRLVAQQADRARTIAPEGPLADRVAAFCAQRATMLEIVAPSARASALRLPYSTTIRRNWDRHYARVRVEVEAVFAPELAAAGVDGPSLTYAVLAHSTWPAWSILRDDLGLDVDQATGVMRRTVLSLLG